MPGFVAGSTARDGAGRTTAARLSSTDRTAVRCSAWLGAWLFAFIGFQIVSKIGERIAFIDCDYVVDVGIDHTARTEAWEVEA